MYMRVGFQEFRDALLDGMHNNQFTFEGLECLFDYFEQREEDLGEPYLLDVCHVCAYFAEGTWEEIAEAYGIHPEGDESLESAVRRCLNDKTYIVGDVGEVPIGCVYEQF